MFIVHVAFISDRFLSQYNNFQYTGFHRRTKYVRVHEIIQSTQWKQRLIWPMFSFH